MKNFCAIFVDNLVFPAIIDNRMDTHNDTTMAVHEVRLELRGYSVAVGAKQLRKALASDKARRVYLARNADPAITEPIVLLCRQNGVSCVWVRSMKELGEAAGIEVGAAAAAALI